MNKKNVSKSSTKSIRVYEDTLEEVKAFIKSDPRQTIIRFYDEAAKNYLKNSKQIKNENRTSL